MPLNNLINYFKENHQFFFKCCFQGIHFVIRLILPCSVWNSCFADYDEEGAAKEENKSLGKLNEAQANNKE